MNPWVVNRKAEFSSILKYHIVMIMSEYMTSAAMSIRAGIPLLFRTPKPLGSRRNSDAEKKARELLKTHELALATKINTITVSAARPHVLLGSKAATPLKPETLSPRR